jgi:hypothetical protein
MVMRNGVRRIVRPIKVGEPCWIDVDIKKMPVTIITEEEGSSSVRDGERILETFWRTWGKGPWKLISIELTLRKDITKKTVFGWIKLNMNVFIVGTMNFRFR